MSFLKFVISQRAEYEEVQMLTSYEEIQKAFSDARKRDARQLTFTLSPVMLASVNTD